MIKINLKIIFRNNKQIIKNKWNVYFHEQKISFSNVLFMLNLPCHISSHHFITKCVLTFFLSFIYLHIYIHFACYIFKCSNSASINVFLFITVKVFISVIIYCIVYLSYYCFQLRKPLFILCVCLIHHTKNSLYFTNIID